MQINSGFYINWKGLSLSNTGPLCWKRAMKYMLLYIYCINVKMWIFNLLAMNFYMTWYQSTSTFHRHTQANHPPLSSTVYTLRRGEYKELFLHTQSSVNHKQENAPLLHQHYFWLTQHFMRIQTLYNLVSVCELGHHWHWKVQPDLG